MLEDIPPQDLEFKLGMYKRGIDSPRMVLPESQDKLFVTKAIGKYEPIIAKKS